MKKRICFLLLFLMVFSLAACSGEEQTSAPTETTALPTTQPAPTAADVFTEAAGQTAASEGAIVTYTIDKKQNIGSDVYRESESVSLLLSGQGTDAFLSSATRTFTWGEGDATYQAVFHDAYTEGTYFSRMGSVNLSSSMTTEEYLAQYLPAVLFTPDLYESIEFVDETTIAFSGAAAPEPWLKEGNFELVEASGTAVVGSGKLEDCTYHLVFTQGGVVNEWDITLMPRTGVVDVTTPQDPDSYSQVEDASAPLAYERAAGMALQAHDFTFHLSSTIVIEAGAAAMSEQSSILNFGTGKDLAAQYDYNISLVNLSTQKADYTYTIQEIFKNGIYTASENDGAVQADRTITAAMMEQYTRGDMAANFFITDSFETLTIKDLGAVSLVEFRLTEATAKQFTTSLCGAVYENANLLNELSTAYRTETAEGFVGIDNTTGLPTMIGLNYLGYHTIDGDEYGLAYDLTQNFTFGTAEGYETVMGEPLPPEEPEEKATPLLYHVTGENGEEMWLFGTIHVGDERTAFLPQNVLDAFNAADALALEFDSDAFEDQLENDPELLAKIQEYYFYTDGSTTADHISDEGLWDAAQELLKATGNYNTSVLLMKPVILSTFLENGYMNLARTVTSTYGMDNQLLSMAQKLDKEILSVESAEFQIEMLTGYSDELQELLLMETLTADAYTYQKDVQNLYEMWCRGDEAELTSYLNEPVDTSTMTEEELALYEEYWNAMSTERNEDMLEVAKGYLAGDKVVFYAVGLAHLLAEDGLVNTLREAGFTVELVSTP